jgi:exonuclease III
MKKKKKMRFMFWNIRGFGAPARRRQVRELIVEEKLDGIGLQETIRQEFSQSELKELGGGHQFVWTWKEAKGILGVFSWV